MYNLASTEYDLPVELSHDEVNEYIACLPDGSKAEDIKHKLRQSLFPIIGAFSDPARYEIILTRGREAGVKTLLRVLADTFMARSEPKFLMPYAILMQNIPSSVASIFENDVAMRRLKTLYIPTTLQRSWTCKDFLKQYLNGNVILLYASLCTEFGWIFSTKELSILSEMCYEQSIPLALDISHLLVCSKVVSVLIPDRFPILIGDFKYGFGPVGLGFIIISRQLVHGWNIQESLKEQFNDVIFPLLPFITYKSISASLVPKIDKIKFDEQNWNLQEKFIKTIQSNKDFTICSYDSGKDAWTKYAKTPFTIVLLLDPNSDFSASGFMSFFVMSATGVINGDLLQNKLMESSTQVFLARCNPVKGIIYTCEKNIFTRTIEIDESLEQTLVCSFPVDLSTDDIKVVVHNLVKVIRVIG
jgi:hypothetical protein